jgi:tRNA(Ile)-lysidine synthase
LRTVDHMNAAQTTLEQAAHDFSLVHIRQDKGDLVVSADGLANMQSDTARRVFAAALGWVGGHAHRPRFDQLIAAAKAVLHGDTTTLAGCILTPSKDGNIRIQREASKTPEIAMTGDDSCIVWDGRWQMVGPFVAGMTIKALGDAVKDCPDWRETGTPRASLLGSPSVWHKGKLVSAPLADFGNGWSAQIVANFHSSAFAIED